MDTIAAISTPPGEGAVAMLRLTGPGAIEIAYRIFRPANERNVTPMERVAVYGHIVDGTFKVDDVLTTIFRNPKSFTGEDMAEISCHGGVLLAAKILELLLCHGARLAEPGEFSQRAFLNGKLDLTQAEAIMDLIHAQTPLALRAASEQKQGRIGQETEAIRKKLLEIVAHLEAYIDFPEEGIEPQANEQLLTRARQTLNQIDALLNTATEGRVLREGVRLALCGKPNAGKSSLLNCLLGYERAIVSEIPGTTRDTIEELASLKGIPFRITDTAGLRETSNLVETQGIERARRAIEQADIILEVIDATQQASPEVIEYQKPKIIAWNKSDLVTNNVFLNAGNVLISCKTGHGIEQLVTKLVETAGHHTVSAPVSLAAINARHQACLQRAQEALVSAIQDLQAAREPELVAVSLHVAIHAVGEIAGRIDTEEILGQIFSSFCIGK